jgi:NAD(P)-dependent dehydrogenase (short-subunit alcohol dehydrogenase family)
MTVSLVTGCSNGIGAAIALRLAREDVADVVRHPLTTDEPASCHPVGTDGEGMTARRPEFTDEAWIAAQGAACDEDWWTFITDVTGVERA